MEHQEAIEIYAAEGYLLDELTDAQRDEFELHFADCESCFADVRDGVRFISAMPAPAKEVKPPSNSHWPAMAAAASLAFLLTAGTGELLVAKPLRAQVTRQSAQLEELRQRQEAPTYRLTEARSPSRIVNGKTPSVLEFDVISDHPAPPYTCTITDAGGKTWRVETVSEERAKQAIVMPMASGALPPGDYKLTVTGTGGVSENQFSFTVQ
jgi:hypothetical protein